MSFLYALEKIRFPALDWFMQVITEFGSETIFLVAALVMYWCVNKKQAYYLMAVGFLGTISNQFLKLACRVPRPWIKDPEFTIVESARADATGYSFPSGHSQAAVGTFGSLLTATKKKGLRIACVAMMLLVPFSRMYLGVHTPADVLVGSASALILVVLLRPVVFSEKKWAFPVLLGVMIGCGAGYVAYVELGTFPPDTDPENLAHAAKNAYTLLGAMLGFLVGYVLDEKKLHFPVRACWWAQLLKVVLGAGVTVGLKELLESPLNSLLQGHDLAHGIRYLLVVVFATAVWPMTFRWFASLGGKKA